MTAPGFTFPTGSSVVGQVDQALAPLSDEEKQRRLLFYQNWKRADEARRMEHRPGVISGIARGALQGVTFGFGDELWARVKSLGDATYSEAVKGEREAIAAFREDHPVLAFASEIAGGLAIPVGGALKGVYKGGRALEELAVGARTIAKAGTLSRLARGAEQGALYAGLYGAGTAEGGLGDRLEAGANAAVTGAVLGGLVFPAIGGTIRWGGRVTGLTSAIGGVLRRGQAQGRAFLLGVMDENNLNPRQLKSIVERSDIPNETMADVMGGPGQHAASGAATFATASASRFQTFTEQRMAGQGEEILSRFRTHARLAPEDVTKTVESLIGERASRSAPLYDAVNTWGVLDDPRLRGPELQRLLQRPGFRRAYEQASKLAAEAGSSLPKPDDLQQITLGLADWIKKGMDDVLYAERSPLAAAVSGNGPGFRAALTRTRSEFLNAVDENVARVEGVPKNVGTYARAREAFAGPTRLMSALEDGQSLWARKDLNEAVAEFGALTRSEQEMYRRGATDGLRARLEEVGDSRDKLKGFFDSPADRQRIRMALGDARAVNQFQQELEQEAEKVQTRNLLRNSLTAEREQFKSRIAGGGVTGAIARVLSGSPRQGLQALTSGLGRGGPGTRVRAEEVMRLLSSGMGGKNELLGALDELIAEEQKRLAYGAMRMGIKERLTAQAAVVSAPTGARYEGQQ